jgi:hypothetical protein
MASSGSGSAPLAPEWMRASAARLDFYESALVALQEERRGAAAAAASGGSASSSGGPGGAERAEPTAARSAPPGWAAASGSRPPSYGVLPPRDLPASPEAELACLRLARSAPLGFSPQRRAAMIEGRPVVVRH